MEVEELLNLVRRNEQIQRRLDQVEDFLLAHHDLHSLLRHLARQVAQVYELEAVTLVLTGDNQRLGEALAADPENPPLPEGCLWRPRKELRVLLGDIERPYLTNRVTPELGQCFFPGGDPLGSLAVIPLWVRDEMLGALALGSAQPKRFGPGLDTHFLARLGIKTARALDAALLLRQSQLFERRQAAMEMAGAACHELSQPLTTLTLQLDLLLRGTGGDDPRRATLLGLMANAERMGELVKRISQVSKYVTRPYAQGLRIIDVEAASAPASDDAAGGEK
jgi:uncharacterized protein YigA (DUF484 family)